MIVSFFSQTFLGGSIILLMTCCNSTSSVIGFINTQPVSIDLSDSQEEQIEISVESVSDTLRLSARGHGSFLVHDVRRSSLDALTKAFELSTPEASSYADNSQGLLLRLILLDVNYDLRGYYSNIEITENLFSFGPRQPITTTGFRPYSIATQYKAVLYSKDDVIAVFENAIMTPGTEDMRSNLEMAISRMAERLNTDVVDFLLKVK
jgi:hypothetical protein